MSEANPKTNSYKYIPKEKQQTQDNDIESLNSLIAQIEQERDYFHTCIYSQRLLRRKTTEPALTVGQY
ncbi:MAG: hypothetical protein AB4368_27030 [Xenococcaceae cyanobacterium]